MSSTLETEYKDELLAHLSSAIKQIQVEHLSNQHSPEEGDDRTFVTNTSISGKVLCSGLDMIFAHGLKFKEDGYWLAVRYFCRSDTIRTIEQLNHVKTNAGKGRAWILTALNENGLEGYLQSFQLDLPQMYKHYHRYSILCSSQISVLQTLISGLDQVTFSLYPDTAHLDFRIHADRSKLDRKMRGFSLPQKELGSVVHIDTTTITELARKSRAKATEFVKGHFYQEKLSENDIGPKKLFATEMQTIDAYHHRLSNKNYTLPAHDCLDCIKKKNLVCTCSSNLLSSSEQNHVENASVKIKTPTQHIDQSTPRDTDMKASLSKVQNSHFHPAIITSKHARVNPFNYRSDSSDSLEQGKTAEFKRFDKNFTISDSKIEVIRKTKKKGRKEHKVSDSGIDSSSKCSDDSTSQNLTEVQTFDDTDSMNNDSDKVPSAAAIDTDETSISCESVPSVTTDSHVCNVMNNVNTDSYGIHQDCSMQECSEPDMTANQTLKICSGIERSTSLSECSAYISRLSLSAEHTGDMQLENDTLADKNGMWQSALQENVTTISGKEDVRNSLDDNNMNFQENAMAVSDFNEPLSPIFFNETQECGDNPVVARFSSSMQGNKNVDAFQNVCLNRGAEISHRAVVDIDNTLRLYLLLEVLKDESEVVMKLFYLSTGHGEGNCLPLYLLISDRFIYFMRDGDENCHYHADYIVSYKDLDYIYSGFRGQVLQFVFYTTKRDAIKGTVTQKARTHKKLIVDTADECLAGLIISTLSEAFAVYSNQHGIVKVCPPVFFNAEEQEACLQKFIKSEGLFEKIKLYYLVHWEDSESTSGTNVCTVVLKGILDYKARSMWRAAWKERYFVLTAGKLHQYLDKYDVLEFQDLVFIIKMTIELATPPMVILFPREIVKPEMTYDLQNVTLVSFKRSHSSATNLNLEFELQYNGKKLELRGRSDAQVTEWLRCLKLLSEQAQGLTDEKICSDSNAFKSGDFSSMISCCLIVADESLLLFHEDLQTGFCRSLSKISGCDVKSVCIDCSNLACKIESDQVEWNLYFSCLNSLTDFVAAISNFANSPVCCQNADEETSVHFKEARAYLSGIWTKVSSSEKEHI